MHKRLYSKLYVNKNREEGSEKIYLGYQNDSTEYPLIKDKETYFNIPPYTTPVALKNTTLVIDGATGGSFPAVSDRIFESRKNYGGVSNNGTPIEVADGVWFCSWLYKDPITGSLDWYDRYFDPKQLNQNLYSPETSNGINFILNAPPNFQSLFADTIIYDTPSKMVLEPGVLYKYFHIGENTANNILTTFGGASAERLLLNITDWKSEQAGPFNITINSSASSSDLFPNPFGSQLALSSALGFNHNQNVEAYIDWNGNYIPSKNEFTLGLWCQSNNWSNCPSTQLCGNYSARGGFGLFVDTNQTYPYFVIPEVTYGHLLFINQESQGFLDKVVVSELSSLSLHVPDLIAIDSNDCTVVCSDGTNPSIYKLDHVGNLLAKTNLNLSANETTISLVCDSNDNVVLTTNLAVYTFDSLLLTSNIVYQTISTQNAASAFSYSVLSGTATLVTVPDALDVKYIEDVQWSILSDGNIYKNGELFLASDGASQLLYPVNLSTTWSSFMNKYAVWVNPETDALQSVPQTIYRTFNAPSNGYYTFNLQGDNVVTWYIDDLDNSLLAATDFSSSFPVQTTKYLKRGVYMMKFVVVNTDNGNGNGTSTWLTNPAGFAATITDSTNNIVWSTRSAISNYNPISNATNLHIDPNGKLWVLHGTNKVSVFDPSGDPFQDPLFTITVGTDFVHTKKYISFIKKYDRSTLSFKWVSVIFYGDSHYIYTNSLDGKVDNIVDISPFINYTVAKKLQQNFDTFKYGVAGDFTGYEYKRVFGTLSPSKKLVVKMALKDKSSSNYLYKTFKTSVSIEDWNPNTWKHILVTHKNKTVTLYLNSIKQASFQYSGRYELTFETQPSMFIGSPLGASNGLNKELGSTTSIFNGVIGEIKLYDYCIDTNNFDMFLRAGVAAEDIIWSLPTPSVSYIEKIERMFKNKLPGSKSNFYNIKLSGTNIKDPNARAVIEEQIKNIVSQISPLHTDLVKIIWIG